MTASDPNTLQEDWTLLSPPVPPMSAPSPPPAGYDGLLMAAAVLLVAVGATLAWRLRRSAYRGSGEAAERIALRELASWEGLNDPQRYREAVSAVSATARRYLQARFRLLAPVLTTREFWSVQHASHPIPAEHVPFWEEFLERSDEIKYAGLRPTTDQFQALLAAAIGFVRASRPRGLVTWYRADD